MPLGLAAAKRLSSAAATAGAVSELHENLGGTRKRRRRVDELPADPFTTGLLEDIAVGKERHATEEAPPLSQTVAVAEHAPEQVPCLDSNQQRNVIFVGVGGPSGVGKSTLISELVRQYNSPCSEIYLACAFKKPDDMPRYNEVLAGAEILPFAPDGKQKNCLGSEHCYDTASCINEDKLTSTLTELERFFSSAARLPQSYHLAHHGNIIREEHRGRPLPDGPVIIFVCGPLLSALDNAMRYFDVLFWMHCPDSVEIGRRRLERHLRSRFGNKRQAVNDTFEKQFMDSHKLVDMAAYAQTLARQSELGQKHNAIQPDATLPAKQVAEAAGRELDAMLRASVIGEWKVQDVDPEMAAKAEKLRSDLQASGASSSSVPATGPKTEPLAVTEGSSTSVAVTGPGSDSPSAVPNVASGSGSSHFDLEMSRLLGAKWGIDI